MVGLGTGALAMYLDPYQAVDFYELDPDILKIAKEYFTFLNRSTGQINYILGDARRNLLTQAKGDYQLILVDAFSGDSIPAHLLTEEAIRLYRQHLTEDGMIIFHVTNRYVNFKRPLIQTALQEGAYVCYKNDLDVMTHAFNSEWIGVTWHNITFHELVKNQWIPLNAEFVRGIRPWSDQYSNILPYLDFRNLTTTFSQFSYLPFKKEP